MTPQGAGAVLRLREGSQIIGRNDDCDHLFGDRSVSRQHAKITVSNGDVVVEDLGSRNGTLIDGQAITNGTLVPGQTVSIGSLSFRLIVADSEVPDDSANYSATDAEIGHLRNHPLFGKLTEAQLKVFRELLTGATEDAIARKMLLAKTTVHNHAKNIYSTLGVHNRMMLLKLFLESTR